MPTLIAVAGLALVLLAQPAESQGRIQGTAAATARARAATVQHARAEPGVSAGIPAARTESGAALTGPPQQRAPSRPFRHATHRSVECRACHDPDRARGRVTIPAPRDCERCHHSNAAPGTCSRCHASDAAPGRSYPASQTMVLAGHEQTRVLAFDHGQHAHVACVRCHTGAPAMTVAANSCAGCHADHHVTQRNCMACHETPARAAHPVEAHLSCSGSSCHAATFVSGDVRTRQVCLACHQDQKDHRPGESCVSCHVLPPPRAGEADP